MENETWNPVAILSEAHFNAFNEFSKLSRVTGQMRKWEKALKALATIEHAQKYVETNCTFGPLTTFRSL